MIAIELDAIELFAFHGVLPEERRDGQRFLVDLELEYADDGAPRGDRIADAVDYREVVALVREVSDHRTYHLIEAFAADVADELIARFPLERVRIRVRKPNVLLDPPVHHAAAIVERRRGSFERAQRERS
jgi:7,8-dihydroneopterin aldolase/epimerase/oxygenase